MSRLILNGIDVNSKSIINVADGVNPTDAVNLQQLQNTAIGLDWKDNVRTASTANINIASGVVNGASIGGVTVATGDRVLLMGQTTGSENGIRSVAASGAASRSTDANTTAKIKDMIVRVAEGTFAEHMYQLVTDSFTLDTTALSFTEFGAGGATYTADGQGIEVAANQFTLELDGNTLSKSATGLRVGSGAAGAGLVEATGVLAVGAGTGITVAADTVSVDTSIVARKFAADCVATTNPQTFTHSLGTKDVTVTIRRTSDDVLLEADIVAASTTTVSVNFGGAPTVGQYRVIVVG